MTIINSYSDMLLERLPLDDSMRGFVAEINKAGERAGTLTRQLLAFSRQQVLEAKVLNLNTVVAEAEKMLRRMIGEDVILTTSLDPVLGAVKADPGQIEQVLMNLAVNARDAMPQGGKLTIETQNVALDEAYSSRHVGVKPGPYAMLAVTDTGTGMDEATKARIFEPFFTTKEVGRGTGLGLATVHGIVNQSNGHVEVYSEVGIGTTFKVYLPQVESQRLASTAPSLSKVLPRGSETILLVEDEDTVRLLGRHILTSNGYTVLEARDGREAVKILERHTEPIDLMVSDVVMPHLGGRQLAQRIMALLPSCKVLFVSGYTKDAVVRHGVLDVEFEFLQKPYTPTVLLRRVRQVLDGNK